ncbi:mechanosensitive ion channel [bacterium]|nr:mechanosensitive ion channel [bacterium]
MDTINPDILASANDLLLQVTAFIHSLVLPSRLFQVGLVLVLFLAATLIRNVAAPRVEAYLRGLEGVPLQRMRIYAILKRRIRGISFVILSWVAVGVIEQLSIYPSRRYLVVIAATVATAWVLIGLVTRVIRNPFLRRVVTWAGWIYVTLQYTGFLGAATDFLDSLGITLGDVRVTVLGVLRALVVSAVLISAARMITQTITRRLAKNNDISPSVGVLAVKLVQIVMYSAAAYLGLKALGFDLTGLAVLSGAIGVGLGFGLQKVVSNLVSGVIILMDESIKPGDVISIGDTFGWIASLGARYVSVVTRDGREYLIPNEDLITGQVVNWSHSSDLVRLDINFGTSYSDDPHAVRRVAAEAARSVPRVLKTSDPVCHVTGFGDSSVDYVLRFWISDPREGLTNVRGQVFLALWDAFKREGFTIPFPQREVLMLNPTAPRPDAGKELDGRDWTPPTNADMGRAASSER